MGKQISPDDATVDCSESLTTVFMLSYVKYNCFIISLVQFYCENIPELLVVTFVSISMTLSTNTVISIKQVLREEMKPKYLLKIKEKA